MRAAAALRAGREELEVAEVVVGRTSGVGRPLYSRGEAVARLGVGGGRQAVRSAINGVRPVARVVTRRAAMA